MSTNPAEVLKANEAFYDAFRAADWRKMQRLWSQRESIASMHPGHALLTGRDAVMDAWRDILASGPPPVKCTGAQVVILSSTSAMVLCYEDVGVALLATTNVFVLEGDQWLLVHHQAGPVAEQREAVRDEDWN